MEKLSDMLAQMFSACVEVILVSLALVVHANNVLYMRRGDFFEDTSSTSTF